MRTITEMLAGLELSPHLQGIAVTQPQLLFIVLHGPVVVLHVPQGGSQGHVDDGQLGPRSAQQLCEIQLGSNSEARPALHLRAHMQPLSRHPSRG